MSRSFVDLPANASARESRRQIANPPPCHGWTGDRIEQRWCEFIADVVAYKISSASKPGFELFEDNWLLVYENLPLPAVHLRDAAENLCRCLPKKLPYSQLLLLSQSHLVLVDDVGMRLFQAPLLDV
jgi:hypothetical protein